MHIRLRERVCNCACVRMRLWGEGVAVCVYPRTYTQQRVVAAATAFVARVPALVQAPFSA